ncbi:MAG: 30S ribosome-binding factor RbfA [Actinomycetia bacterium]|nr:30S ribosome-binding factor RbfA [Actinomycetes bacterium]
MRKVDELVREVVAEAVTELKDPRIGFLTITGAKTSPDLRYAIVFYSVLGTEEEKEETAVALESAKARIQRAIATETRLRYTPKLKFRVDPAIDEGIRISQIIAEMHESERGSDDGDHEDE